MASDPLPPPPLPPGGSHWFARGQNEPRYELVISECQAVRQAVGHLGGTADVGCVQAFLSERGMAVEPSVIEHVLAELGLTSPPAPRP